MSIPSQTGSICPRCQTPITPDSPVALCNTCGAVHHGACWAQGQPCATPGCMGAPSITAGMVTPPPVQAMPTPPPVTTSMPPIAAAVPPPPMPGQPAMPPQRFGAAQEMALEGERTLVVRSGIVFPQICLATGRADNLVLRKRRESWAPPYLALFGALAYSLAQRSGDFQFYLNKDYLARRLKWILINWGVGLLCFFGAFPFLTSDYLVIIGLILLFSSIIAPLVIYSICIKLPYTVLKVENGYLWLKFKDSDIAATLYDAYRAGC